MELFLIIIIGVVLIKVFYNYFYKSKEKDKIPTYKYDSNNSKVPNDKLTLSKHKMNNGIKSYSSVENVFKPYKIVENDNSLRTIVNDYEYREKKSIKDFETRLGKALPNDVIWSILQDLAIEGIENKNPKLCINVEYQRGLLLQKEKKYKQAISHYSMGLYYLMNFYPHKLNPINHIIDFVKNDIEVIEMSQYKFINKIKRCELNESLKLDDLIELIINIPKNTTLSTVSPKEFLEEVLLILRDFKTQTQIKEEFNYKEVMSSNLDKIDGELSDFIISYEIKPSYSDSTIDIEALRNYGNVYKNINDIPKNLKSYAIPLTDISKEFRNEYDGVPFRLFDIPNNTNGIVEKEIFNKFILTIFEYILGNKKDLSLNEKIIGIDSDTSKNSDFKKIKQYMFGEESPSKVWLIYELTQLDGIGKKTAEKLYLNNIRNKNELINASDELLKKISPKCIKLKKELAI